MSHRTRRSAAGTDLPRLRARIGMVFQNFELFPHLSVRANLVLGQVKVDAKGLAPATDHWYRFRVGDRTSPVGRTRTLADGSPLRVYHSRQTQLLRGYLGQKMGAPVPVASAAAVVGPHVPAVSVDLGGGPVVGVLTAYDAATGKPLGLVDAVELLGEPS